MSPTSAAFQRQFGSKRSESLGIQNSVGGPHTPPSPGPGKSQALRVGPAAGRTRTRDAGHMELSRIVADPDRLRTKFDNDAIERPMSSLLKYGQLMPIRVRRSNARF